MNNGNGYYAPSAPVVTTMTSNAPVVTNLNGMRYPTTATPSASISAHARYPSNSSSTPTTAASARHVTSVAPAAPTYFTTPQAYHMHHPQSNSLSSMNPQAVQSSAVRRSLVDASPLTQSSSAAVNNYYQPQAPTQLQSMSAASRVYPHAYARGASTSSLVPALTSLPPAISSMTGHRNSFSGTAATIYGNGSANTSSPPININHYGNGTSQYTYAPSARTTASTYTSQQSVGSGNNDIGGGRGAFLRAMAAPPPPSSSVTTTATRQSSLSSATGMSGITNIRALPMAYNNGTAYSSSSSGASTLTNNGIYPSASSPSIYGYGSADFAARAAVGASAAPVRLRQRL
jgi:hypothetical protein